MSTIIRNREYLSENEKDVKVNVRCEYYLNWNKDFVRVDHRRWGAQVLVVCYAKRRGRIVELLAT